MPIIQPQYLLAHRIYRVLQWSCAVPFVIFLVVAFVHLYEPSDAFVNSISSQRTAVSEDQQSARIIPKTIATDTANSNDQDLTEPSFTVTGADKTHTDNTDESPALDAINDGPAVYIGGTMLAEEHASLLSGEHSDSPLSESLQSQTPFTPDADVVDDDPVANAEDAPTDDTPQHDDIVDRDDEFNGYETIRGRIINQFNQPIVRLRLSIERRVNGRLLARTTVTSEDGRFLIEDLVPGDYLLRTAGLANVDSHKRMIRSGTSSTLIQLSEKQAAILRGIVVNMRDEPIRDVQVSITSGAASTRTDALGRYQMPGTLTSAGSVVVRFQAPGYIPATKQFVLNDDTTLNASNTTAGKIVVGDVKLRSQGGATLSGVVYDEQSNRLAGVLVQIRSSSADVHQSTKTDDNGEYQITNVVPADDYSIKASSTDQYQAFNKQDLTIAAARANFVNPTLLWASSGRMSGTIEDPAGQPLANVSLMAMRSGPDSRATTVTSDESGYFELNDFVAENLTFRSRSAPNILIEGARIQPGDDLTASLTVDIGQYLIEGKVLDTGGRPVKDAQVAMRWRKQLRGGLRSVTTRNAVSDKEGRFSFTRVGSGSRTIDVAADSFSSRSVTVDPAYLNDEFEVTLVEQKSQ